MILCHLDFETRSAVDIKTRGAYVYANHPSTEVLIASYKFGEQPVRRWKRGEPCPEDLRRHIESGGEISAWNAAFERLMIWKVLAPRHGWPMPKLEQFRCTAVTAAAMCLPRSLEKCGAALDLKIQKDKRGKKLMDIHSIPTGFTATGEPIWHPLADDPESLEAYHIYCDFDVETEHEAASRLVPLSDAEMRVYWLNEEINDRGLRIDVQSARAAMRIAAEAKRLIGIELDQITGGAVTAVTQHERMKKWLEAQGVVMPSMDKDTVEEFLHDCDDLPPGARRALELRAEGAKPSVDKIAAMLKRVDDDGRARGCYLHNGAGQTLRFSSRGVQAHNMPRYRKIFEDAAPALDTLFQTIRTGEPSALTFMYGPELGRPMHILSDAVRSFIWAAPGHELIVADYSAIEGRFAAWITGEDWKVEAFKAYDRGDGPGIYELTAAKIYGIEVAEVSKLQRSTGKIGELACQYAGSVGAIAKMARQNKFKLESAFERLWESSELERRETALKAHEERLKKHDKHALKMSREAWLVAKLIVLGWRDEHPAICAAWKDLNHAARAAVSNPGVKQSALNGQVSYIVAMGFLWCRLPSGSCLCYGKPIIRDIDAPWADMTLPPEQREKISAILALGADANGHWKRFSLAPGTFFNNVVQGDCRDILVHGMFRARDAGFHLIGHTHDEPFCEEPIGTRSVAEFEKAINQLPDWCATLPLVANGFKSKRYKKA